MELHACVDDKILWVYVGCVSMPSYAWNSTTLQIKIIRRKYNCDCTFLRYVTCKSNKIQNCTETWHTTTKTTMNCHTTDCITCTQYISCVTQHTSAAVTQHTITSVQPYASCFRGLLPHGKLVLQMHTISGPHIFWRLPNSKIQARWHDKQVHTAHPQAHSNLQTC